MNTLIHADIFFFVTTIAVIVLTIVLTIAIIYVIKILSDIKDVSRQVKEETALVREDIQGLRTDIRREGFRLERLWGFFRTLTKGKSARSKKD